MVVVVWEAVLRRILRFCPGSAGQRTVIALRKALRELGKLGWADGSLSEPQGALWSHLQLRPGWTPANR